MFIDFFPNPYSSKRRSLCIFAGIGSGVAENQHTGTGFLAPVRLGQAAMRNGND